MSLLLIAAVFTAYIVKGMCGFANTLVFSTIMSFKQNNIDISPVDLLLGYPSNVILAFKNRKTIKISMVLPLILMVFAGVLPGTFLLKMGDTRMVKMLFGFVVVFIGSEMLYREHIGKEGDGGKAFLIFIGVLSGILCGLFGVGALLAAYVGRTTKDTASFKGNICVVFLAENTFRIILYIVTGILNIEILKQAICLVPAMAAGLLTGMLFGKILDEKKAKTVIIIMLILSGISLIVTNL